MKLFAAVCNKPAVLHLIVRLDQSIPAARALACRKYAALIRCADIIENNDYN
jgi:hypothetical protein